MIDYKLDISQVALDMDRLIPLGLILNETITNAVKHAFTDINEPAITLSVTRDEDNFTLNIIDNGIGIAEDIDMDSSNTLGSKIIKTLVRQLSGDLQIKSGADGTRISITCPL